MRLITNYFMRHCQAAISSLGQFSRVPLASFMTCLILGIALALPTALFVALKNFENLGASLQNTMQVLLYLKPSMKEADVNKFVRTLQTNQDISHLKIISPDQGLKELQKQSGFQGALFSLADNPLPWTIVILPDSANKLESLVASLQALPQVESIQFDKLWVQRLASLASLAHRIIYALTLFLGLAVFLIINNAIRSATQQNHREIKLIKLIGGTYAFIRRPFLYAGMVYGLLGGIVAWQLVDILLLTLKGPIYHLANLYGGQFQLLGIGLYNTLILLASSVLLGLLASWSAVNRHLKAH